MKRRRRFIDISDSPKGFKEGILENEKLFDTMYGREPQEEDGDNFYVFWNMYFNKQNYDSKMINVLRHSKVSEDIIYAYYKTGLIITKYNEKKLLKKDIKEINKYIKEYRKLLFAKINGKVCNIIQGTYASNKLLLDKYNKVYKFLHSSYNDFMRRHIENKQDFLDYKIQNEVDFLGFCSIKILKDLESMDFLFAEQMVEHIYSTSRSIFETYLYVINLAHEDNFFVQHILNPMKECEYNFLKTEDGHVNYSQLIMHNKKIKKKLSMYDLAKRSPYKSDILLYNSFYGSACQFVHLDPMSAKSYFHGSDPFHEIDSGLTAALIGLTCSSLALGEFTNIKQVQSLFRKDVRYLANQLKENLKICFEVLQNDEYNRNDIFKSFQYRLNEKVI